VVVAAVEGSRHRVGCVVQHWAALSQHEFALAFVMEAPCLFHITALLQHRLHIFFDGHCIKVFSFSSLGHINKIVSTVQVFKPLFNFFHAENM
jgi:hypothetical protein